MRLSAPFLRPAVTAVIPLLLFLIVGPSMALAQVDHDTVRTGTETTATYPWYVQSVTSAAVTLVVGGLLIAIAPDATRAYTDRALEKPGPAFVYGFASLIAVIGLAFVLAITVIGIVVAIPMLLIYAVVGVIAGEFGYLAVGRLVNDRWPSALGVAIVVSMIVGAVPVFGTLVGFVISGIGIGTVVMAFLEGR